MKRTSSQPRFQYHGLAPGLVLRRLAHHPRNIKPSSQDLCCCCCLNSPTSLAVDFTLDAKPRLGR
ncbi:hypothetical protein C8R44DRAFT_775576, partial [Mycena epipterygia]